MSPRHNGASASGLDQHSEIEIQRTLLPPEVLATEAACVNQTFISKRGVFEWWGDFIF